MSFAPERGFISDVKIIDSHVHLHKELPLDESVRNIKEKMEYFNYTALNLLGLPKYDDDITQNVRAIYIKSLLSPKLYAFAGLYHRPAEKVTPEYYLDQIKMHHKAGFDGYKMLEGKPSYYNCLKVRLDDPVYDLFFDYAQAKGIHILYHVNDPSGFWDIDRVSQNALKMGWFYGDGSFPSMEELYNQINNILTKFPKLKITFAHFYFISEYIDKACEFLYKWENVCFDLTPDPYMYDDFNEDRKGWREFFIKYRKRIIYGTDFCDDPVNGDYPVGMIRTFLETEKEHKGAKKIFTGIGLEKDVLEDIYYNNFINRSIKPLDIESELVVKECDMILGKDLSPQARENVLKVKRYFSSKI